MSLNFISVVTGLIKKQIGIFSCEKRAIFAFLTVGFLTAAIYFALFALLWQFLGLNYKVAVSITYVFTVLFHFTANRRFTFKAHESQLLQQITKYACMIGLNYVSTLIVMYFIVEVLHISPYVGLMLSIIVNTNANFLMSRYWVFRIQKTI